MSLHSLLNSFLFQCGYACERLTKTEKRLVLEIPQLGFRQLCYRQAFLELASVGEISISEGRFLCSLISELKSHGPVIEIGSLFGQSTRLLLSAIQSGRQVISVDNYSWNPLGLPPAIHKEILSAILAEAVTRGELILRDCNKDAFYLECLSEVPSAVFLDAIHTYEETLKDISWAQEVGAELICGHDYCETTFPGVVQAVQEKGGPARLEGTLWTL